MASQINGFISVMGVQELDRLANHFRRKLRDAAVKWSEDVGDSDEIGPDDVRGSAGVACRELLSDLACDSGERT
jgi:hypothetical protein